MTVLFDTGKDDKKRLIDIIDLTCLSWMRLDRRFQRQRQGSEDSTTETGICADLAERRDTWEVKDSVIDKLESFTCCVAEGHASSRLMT